MDKVVIVCIVITWVMCTIAIVKMYKEIHRIQDTIASVGGIAYSITTKLKQQDRQLQDLTNDVGKLSGNLVGTLRQEVLKMAFLGVKVK